MTKEDRELFNEVNQLFDDWEKYGTAPNGIKQAKNLLNEFYKWAGKEPKDNERFNTRMSYDEDELDEMRDIAKSVLDSDLNFDPDALYEKFQAVDGKHGIDTFEDYVEFLDQKEIFSKENVISSSMSYYEYEKLMKRAESKNISQKKLNEKIERAFLKRGLKGEQLYEFVYRNLRPRKP